MSETSTAVRLDIRPISIREVLGRSDLLDEHYQELATDKALMRLDPRHDIYCSTEDADGLFVLGAFEGPNLVGYSVNFVHPHLHYQSLTVAENDVLFLALEHRNAGAGRQIIAATEAEAKARGARLVMWHAKPGTALERLLSVDGYRVQDVVFSRGL